MNINLVPVLPDVATAITLVRHIARHEFGLQISPAVAGNEILIPAIAEHVTNALIKRPDLLKQAVINGQTGLTAELSAVNRWLETMYELKDPERSAAAKIITKDGAIMMVSPCVAEENELPDLESTIRELLAAMAEAAATAGDHQEQTEPSRQSSLGEEVINMINMIMRGPQPH